MKAITTTTLMLSLSLAMASRVPAIAELPLPHYAIERTEGPIAVDGFLREAAWDRAQRIDNFSYPWFKEGFPEQTVARLLWDDERLYISFVAHDTHISAHYQQRDEPVSRDDCVEVFIAPEERQLHNYFNFEFNALGTILDRSPHSNRSSAWNAKNIKVAIRIDGTLNDHSDIDEQWITELSIPFTVFSGFASSLPPVAGDSWRLNLYRTGGEINLQYATWSDTHRPKPQFHAPDRFGVVHFAAPIAP